MFHDVDDVVSSLWGEFFTRYTRYTEDIAGILDRHYLRAKANAQIWNFIFSRISRRLDHPLGSTSSESSWNTDPVEIL